MKIQSWPIACRSALALAALLFASPLAAQTGSTEVLNENVLQILGIEKDHFTVANPGAEPGTAAALKKARQFLSDGVSAMQRGDGKAALASFKDAKKEDPSLSQPNLYLARLCFATNDQNIVNAGRGFLEQAAAEKEAMSPEPHLLLAKLALNENRLSDAELQFAKAMELVAKLPEGTWADKRSKDFKKEIHAGKASAHEKLRNWEDAQGELKLWEEISKGEKDAMVHLRMGQLLFMMGVNGEKPVGERITGEAVTLARKELQLAYDDADKVGEKDEDKVKAVLRPELLLLDMLTGIEEIKLAEAEIAALDAAAADLDADAKEGARTWQAVAQWYLRQGNFDKARDYAERAKKLDAASPAIEQLNAMVAYFASDVAGAKAAFKTMYEKNPADFFASNAYALILAESSEQADKDKAVAIAEVNARANQQNQSTAEAASTLGWVYHLVGRNVDAAGIFAKLEQANGLQISADTAYYMARVFNSLKKADVPDDNARAQIQARARQLLEQALGTKGAFRYRQAAKKWYFDLTGEEFDKAAPSTATSSSSTPSVTPASTKPKEPTPPATTPPADGAGT